MLCERLPSDKSLIKDGTREEGEEWRKRRTEGLFRMCWRTGPGAEGCSVHIGPKKENQRVGERVKRGGGRERTVAGLNGNISCKRSEREVTVLTCALLLLGG